MDTGKGNFTEISQLKAEAVEAAMGSTSGVFHVGEELTIKGSTFRVASIRRKGLKLKLLKGEI